MEVMSQDKSPHYTKSAFSGKINFVLKNYLKEETNNTLKLHYNIQKWSFLY